MEKFSKFRDAGTGIQVFLPPVAPAGSTSPAHLLLLPFLYIIGAARAVLLLAVVILWSVFESVFALLGAGGAVRSIFLRVVLIILGFFRVARETIALASRGRGTAQPNESPKKGDLIISNHSSLFDVLLLASHYPTYLIPVVTPPPTSTRTSSASTSGASRSPAARRRGPAAYMPEQVRAATTEKAEPRKIVGWKAVGLLGALSHAGRQPLEGNVGDANVVQLDEALKASGGPCVVFPELVTSNNRALLKPAAVFPTSWTKLYASSGALRGLPGSPTVFITTIKYDVPTPLQPSLTTSVPRSLLASLWSALSALPGRSVTIRTLHSAEAPSGQAFPADARGAERGPQEAIADLWASLSRLRRTNLGWEDKEAFLAMYERR